MFILIFAKFLKVSNCQYNVLDNDSYFGLKYKYVLSIYKVYRLIVIYHKLCTMFGVCKNNRKRIS